MSSFVSRLDVDLQEEQAFFIFCCQGKCMGKIDVSPQSIDSRVKYPRKIQVI